MGVGPARNQGLKIAKGEFILILDVDTIIYRNSIKPLLSIMELDRKIGIVGPKLIDPKLDGVRIITILDKEKGEVNQYSRDGRLNDNFPQITASMEKFLPYIKVSMVFDGEMISRNFQALMNANPPP